MWALQKWYRTDRQQKLHDTTPSVSTLSLSAATRKVTNLSENASTAATPGTPNSAMFSTKNSRSVAVPTVRENGSSLIRSTGESLLKCNCCEKTIPKSSDKTADQSIKNMKKTLLLNKSSLTVYKARKGCLEDSRNTSKYLGGMGVLVILAVVSCVILSDIHSISQRGRRYFIPTGCVHQRIWTMV